MEVTQVRNEETGQMIESFGICDKCKRRVYLWNHQDCSGAVPCINCKQLYNLSGQQLSPQKKMVQTLNPEDY